MPKKKVGIRRSNNEGTIYQTKDGKYWKASITWTDANGKHHRKSFSAKTRSAAKFKLDEFRDTLSFFNNNINNDDITFETYCKQWMESKQKVLLKPNSYLRKKQTLENQVYPYIGNIIITDITHADVQNLINKLVDVGYSYSSIKKAYEAINSCIKAYRIENRIYFNPCEGVVLPKNIQKDISKIKYWNAEQLKLIHDEALRKYSNGRDVYRLGNAIVILYLTGWRIGELLALEWSDIKYDEGYIVINKNSVQTLNEDEGKYKMLTQSTPKTKNSNRLTPITPQIKECLNALQAITGDYKWVIATKTGNQVSPRSIYRTFNCILKAADMIKDGECYGVHTLRHSFASLLFKNGCDIKTVSELLGHSDTKITENIYIHLLQEQKFKAMEDLDNYFTL